MPKFNLHMKELGAYVKLGVLHLSNMFEGRPTAELHNEVKIQRRKKILHFVYHSILAASVAVVVTHLEHDTSSWLDLRPGDIIEDDLISPITAQVEPKESAQSYRENLARRIPPVFDYDDRAINQWLRNWRQVFREIREEFYNPKAKTKATLPPIDAKIQASTGKKLRKTQVQFLMSQQFSEELEKPLTRFAKLLTGRLIAPFDLLDQEENNGITVRQINQRMQETLVHDVSQILSVESAADEIMRFASTMRELDPRIAKGMAEIASYILVPNLKPNESLTKKRIALVLSSLKDPVQSVRKGQVIVPKGDRLSEQNFELLQTMLALTSPAGATKRYLYTFGILLIFFVVIFRINMTGRGFWNLPLKDAFFFFVITMITLSATKFIHPHLIEFCEYFKLRGGAEFLIPVATGGILIHLMMGKDAGYTYALVASIIVGYMLDQNYRFTVWSFIVNASAIQSLRSCKQRTDLFKAGAWCGAVGAILVLAFSIISLMGTKQYHWTRLLAEPMLAFISGIVASVIATVLIPFLESAFAYTTSLKLLELSNFNHPLLHTLMMKAPGTYHHSVIVGSLAELAADKVNSNGLLARVSSYYHDIGKMGKPLYFIENQPPNNNPHDHLSPTMSAKILFSHVKNGARLGREYNLGKKIVDIIEQHHGTTLASYFFNKAKKMGEPEDVVDECHFRYPGPKPRTREAGIVMLADACEAATRSIADPTPAKIQAMVHSIITKRFLEEQFSDCELTLRDLQVIEDTFTTTLVSLYHHRIEYPGQKSVTDAGAATPPPKANTRT